MGLNYSNGRGDMNIQITRCTIAKEFKKIVEIRMKENKPDTWINLKQIYYQTQQETIVEQQKWAKLKNKLNGVMKQLNVRSR